MDIPELRDEILRLRPPLRNDSAREYMEAEMLARDLGPWLVQYTRHAAEWARKQTLIDVSDALTGLPDPDAERDGVLRSKLRIGKMLTDMMLGESR